MSSRFSIRLSALAAFAGAWLGLCDIAAAVVKLPGVFTAHMVLQRDQPVPIWGFADPDEQVEVAIADQTKSVTTDATGKWLVRLDKMSAGGPHVLSVKGARNKLLVQDVMFGEVWLASGQSNMVHIMPTTFDFEKEQHNADFPALRIFTVARAVSQAPNADCLGNWLVSSQTTVDDVAAVAFYFGRELHQKLGVPVGVIVSALGSTPIEAWTSLEAQQKQPELAELLASWRRRAAEYQPEAAQAAYLKQMDEWRAAALSAKAAGKPVPREPKAPIHPHDQPANPAVMFNGMIAPLVPYAIRGALWYQGEFNTTSEDYAALYRHQMPLLIADWRSRWGQPDLPFCSVQLPNFETSSRQPVMTGWPLVREGQLLALRTPHTGMAVTIDIGEVTGIHPRNKRDFGHRLALWARGQVYGEQIPWSGPIFASHKVNGNTIELSFRHTDGGLKAKEGDLKGFEIASADQAWHAAAARIVNDKVVVASDKVPSPIAARYSWDDNPNGNLTNGSGLPASPFRTE